MGDGYRPTQAELHEFRNVIALARANYNGKDDEVRLLVQLIENGDAHVSALRAFVHILLLELDGSKRDANDFLTDVVERAAMADARAQ